MPEGRSLARKLARSAGGPFARYFDRRFGGVHEHLDHQSGAIVEAELEISNSQQHALAQHVDAAAAQLAAGLAGEVQQLRHQVLVDGQQLRSELANDTQIIAELSLTLQRFSELMADRLGTVGDELREAIAEARGGLSAFAFDERAQAAIGTPLERLRPGLAELLTWAYSFVGFAGQAGLRMNDGLDVHFVEGGVTVGGINERIVELPFAYAAAVELEPGRHVLDVGASESPLALSLASLGHQVLAIDVRPYPFRHPNLETVTEPIETWAGPSEPFDAVFCISTVEHLGLGAYGDPTGTDDADIHAMSLFRKWLRPGGELILTVPFGRRALDDLQRTYDAQQLTTLLEGWDVKERRLYAAADQFTWEPLSDDAWDRPWTRSAHGVAMLRATAS